VELSRRYSILLEIKPFLKINMGVFFGVSGEKLA
jgi:hypothetical protein